MTTLGRIATGRDNNLNLLRMIAATAVLVSHAWPIALGSGAVEPLKAEIGQSLGTVSVIIFFVISGYLITASFERRASHLGFVLARILRLAPGLVVCLVLTALVLGPLVTSFSAVEYLTLTDPYAFILRNLALFPLQFRLPGVFDGQPLPAVAGSIWTLRHEVLCYAAVFLAGLFGLWRRRWQGSLALGLVLLAWIAMETGLLRLPDLLQNLVRLALPFAIGSAFWLWRDRLPMTVWGLALTVALAWVSRHSLAYYPLLCLAIGYASFWIGFVPRGPIRAYNRLGDYSYGIYIYAFPIQGLAVWIFGPQSPLENVLYSFPPTLLCAVLSWHLIEAPALELRGGLETRLRRLWRRGPPAPTAS